MKVGDKVVCVNLKELTYPDLILYKIYTIRAVLSAFICLDEVGGDYFPSRFIPLEAYQKFSESDIKTSVNILNI